MAAQIKITGWLNGIKEFDWGTTLSVSVTNRIKNQSTGEWETASRDYYDVVLNDGVTLGNIKENDQVVVEGSFKVGKTSQRRTAAPELSCACALPQLRCSKAATQQRRQASTRRPPGPQQTHRSNALDHHLHLGCFNGPDCWLDANRVGLAFSHSVRLRHLLRRGRRFSCLGVRA